MARCSLGFVGLMAAIAFNSIHVRAQPSQSWQWCVNDQSTYTSDQQTSMPHSGFVQSPYGFQRPLSLGRPCKIGIRMVKQPQEWSHPDAITEMSAELPATFPVL